MSKTQWPIRTYNYVKHQITASLFQPFVKLNLKAYYVN